MQINEHPPYNKICGKEDTWNIPFMALGKLGFTTDSYH
jgi:hypothetical protein